MVDKNNFPKIFLLQLVRHRHKLLLDSKSLSELDIFFYGYIWAIKVFEIKDESDKYLEEFYTWINSKYAIEENTMRQKDILLKQTNNNEEKAFDLFFSLLDDFFYN